MWQFVATIGLIATIAGTVRFAPSMTPALVGLYMSAAYWFTASTSFANPAVTIARALSNSFAGIAPHSALAVIAEQFAGTIAAFSARRARTAAHPREPSATDRPSLFSKREAGLGWPEPEPQGAGRGHPAPP